MTALEIIDATAAPPTLNRYHRRCRRRRGDTGVLSLRVTMIEQKPFATQQDPEESIRSKARRDELMAATFGIFKDNPILQEYDLERAREMLEE
jgi:hypothetical protein